MVLYFGWGLLLAELASRIIESHCRLRIPGLWAVGGSFLLAVVLIGIVFSVLKCVRQHARG